MKKQCALDMKMVESYHINSLRNILSSRSEGKLKVIPPIERDAKSMMLIRRKYKYSESDFEKKQKLFLRLFHVSSTVAASNENLFELESNLKFQQYIMREYEQTVVSTEDFNAFASTTQPNDIKIHSIIPRMMFPILKAKQQSLYLRILQALGAVGNLMCFEDFLKLSYYIIDDCAQLDEWVSLVCKILCPDDKKLMLDELIKFLKDHVNPKLQSRVGTLLKAITSNYMISGIIDANGIFDPKKFKDCYLSGMLNIHDLLCIMSLKA